MIILVVTDNLMKLLTQAFYSWYRTLLRHPQYRWWIVLGSFLYLLGPIDISPDVFPIVGWLDDGLIVTLLMTEASQLLVEHLKSQKNKPLSSPHTNSNSEANIIDVDAVSVS
jgi:uncharacterized membrane protein YkvA (DUF1232 family)